MDKARIFIVDDDPVGIDIIRTHLEDLGYAVAGTAASGAEAVEKAGELHPDLILMDIMLDGRMDGIEAAEKIREAHDLPILFLTAYTDDPLLDRAVAAQPFGYLVKPAKQRDLKAAIEMAVSKNRLERKLRESEQRFRLIADFTYDWEFWMAPDGGFTYVSPSAERITGYDAQAFMDDPELFSRIIDPKDRPIVAGYFRETRPPRAIQLEFGIRTREGAFCWIALNCRPVCSDAGEWLGWRGSNRDITVRKELEEELKYRALHDPLTGLPNRELFFDRIGNALSRAHRDQHSVGLLYIDLNRFKSVNDTLGHGAGDSVLKSIAQRIAGAIRETDTAARIGGDEFVIILQDLQKQEDAQLVADRIIQELSEPVPFQDNQCRVGASIGISIYPFDGADPETLLKNADSAMFKAKTGGSETDCACYLSSGEPVVFPAEKRGDGLQKLFPEDAASNDLPEDRLYDARTGLPGKKLFFDRLTQACSRARRYRHFVGLFRIPLLKWEGFISALPPEEGELLLKVMAGRLKNGVRETDTAARIGGSEFAVIVQDMQKKESVTIVAEKLLHSLAEPIPAGGRAHLPPVRMGISLYPFDGLTNEALMKKAKASLMRKGHDPENNCFHSDFC